MYAECDTLSRLYDVVRRTMVVELGERRSVHQAYADTFFPT